MTDLPHVLTDWTAAAGGHETRAALRHVEALQAAARHLPASTARGGELRQIGSVGICGAGLMGTGIAWASLEHRVRVTLYDASHEALERACRELEQCWLSTGTHEEITAWLRPCDSPEPLADCQLLIESVVENRELKQQLLQHLTPRMADDALVATNTSTLRIAELAHFVRDPARFCGLHFCHPVRERMLVEIIPAPETSPATVAAAARYVMAIGKLPLVARDSPGFVVNRLLVPYLNEALELLCEGVGIPTIDRAARSFGIECGPFETLDRIGMDTAMRAGRTMWEAFPDRIKLTPILPRLVKLGRLGRKSGSGFYRYPDPRGSGVEDPTLHPVLAPYVRATRDYDEHSIALRLVLPMLLEATRLLEERLVDHPRDIDLAVLFGLAFPRARGGLLYWADQLGAARIIEMLQTFAPLGSRLHVTAVLQSLAAARGSFYE